MADTQTLQLVDAEAEYNTDGMQAFARQSGLENAGQNYLVVAVMGPQSSGKSTLMNAVVTSLHRNFASLICWNPQPALHVGNFKHGNLEGTANLTP